MSDDSTKRDAVAAEALALAPFLTDVSGGPGTVNDAWRDIIREAREPRGRDGFLTIAMLAIHGAMACDAEAESGK